MNEYHYTKLKESKIAYDIVRSRNGRQIILRNDDNSDKCDNKLKFYNENNDNEETPKIKECDNDDNDDIKNRYRTTPLS